MCISQTQLDNVLRIINEKCGLSGRNPEPITVPELSDQEISQYCRHLKELGFIDVKYVYGKDFDRYYPIRITAAGKNYLAEIDVNLRSALLESANSVIRRFLGIDTMPFSRLIGASYRKIIGAARKKRKKEEKQSETQD